MSEIPVGTGTGAPGPSVGLVRINTFLPPSLRRAGRGRLAFLMTTVPSGSMVMDGCGLGPWDLTARANASRAARQHAPQIDLCFIAASVRPSAPRRRRTDGASICLEHGAGSFGLPGGPGIVSITACLAGHAASRADAAVPAVLADRLLPN